MTKSTSISLFDPAIVRTAWVDAFRKMNPRTLFRSPVMLIVAIGAGMATYSVARHILAGQDYIFELQLTVWLWFTVLFANFAEAIAEGRGKAQAQSLRSAKADTLAKRLKSPQDTTVFENIASSSLTVGDYVLCSAGDVIPADGEIVEGIATVDESAITGESAPVIRESGGDRSAVTGGTKVVSDHIIIRITAGPGDSFLDKMIALVEGAQRQKTPNEIALTILLAGLSIIFMLAVVTLPLYMLYHANQSGNTPESIHSMLSIPVLVGLLACLLPTTIGGLLSAIGISGMDRIVQRNVLAVSGRAVEAAGDVGVLLLDKTGTITFGNRMASAFYPSPNISETLLAHTAQLSSLADETPEGRSIVVLAKEKFNLRAVETVEKNMTFIPFTAQTRMSGVDILATETEPAHIIRKGAAEAIRRYVEEAGGVFPSETWDIVQHISRQGSTPLVVSDNTQVMGVVELKDIVKGGIRERFAELRAMGIRTVMITGDNPLTAASIAAEAGVDDFIAEATPEDKLRRIREEQGKGILVAMMGDGTNDAPALAQADVGVAMNSGTQAAREAGNMVDLDSNPTKLIEVVEIGKQLLMTRGALTTFSIANDVAKYFAILPALFSGLYAINGQEGPLSSLNIMHLASPQSAMLSAVIFNALIIIALIPIAMKGVAYKPLGADAILRRNILVYGIGGLLIPFIGIKVIDVCIVALRLV